MRKNFDENEVYTVAVPKEKRSLKTAHCFQLSPMEACRL